MLEFSEAISKNLLEHAHHDSIKDAMKNNWTNTAIVSALLFTIVAGTGMDSNLEDQSEAGKDVSETIGHAVQHEVEVVFIFCISLSFTQYLVSFLTASIHMMWTESLSAEDAMDYYKTNPIAPAAPMLWLCFGAIWHMVVTVARYVYTHKQGGLFFAIPVMIGILLIYADVRTAWRWSRKKQEKGEHPSWNLWKVHPDPAPAQGSGV